MELVKKQKILLELLMISLNLRKALINFQTDALTDRDSDLFQLLVIIIEVKFYALFDFKIKISAWVGFVSQCKMPPLFSKILKTVFIH